MSKKDTYTGFPSSTLVAKYKYNPVSVKEIPPRAPDNSGFLAHGTAQVSSISIGAAIAVNEVINLAGVEFTAVINPTKEGQFRIGIDRQDTARNLTTAIITHSSEALRAYNIIIDYCGIISIKQNSASSSGINLTGSANMSTTVITPGISGGIDVSSIKTTDGFIGYLPTVNFTVVGQHIGVRSKEIAIANGNITTGSDPVHADDSVGVFRAIIGDRVYQGAFFQPHDGNLFSAELRMVEVETGEYFTIKADIAYAGVVVTAGSTAAIAAELNTLWCGTTFQQTITLDIDTTSVGDILSDQGTVIGSTTGMAFNLTTDNFFDSRFSDFTITPNSNTCDGHIILTAIIKINTTKVRQLIESLSFFPGVLTNLIMEYISDYITYIFEDLDTFHCAQGWNIHLKRTDTNTDKLMINIGKGGLFCLRHTEYIATIEEAFKKLFNVHKKINDELTETTYTTHDVSTNIEKVDSSNLLGADDEA